MIDEKILKEADKIKGDQRKIIQDLLDKGFSIQNADYNFGYIRGVEDMLNIIYNLNVRERPTF